VINHIYFHSSFHLIFIVHNVEICLRSHKINSQTNNKNKRNNNTNTQTSSGQNAAQQ